MDIEKVILARKKLSAGTLKNYLANIKKLHKAVTGKDEIKDLSFLLDKNKVDEYLQGLKPTSRTNYYGVILTLLDPDNEIHELYKIDKMKNNFNNKKDTSVNQTIQDKVLDISEYDAMLDKIKKAGLQQDYMMLLMLKYLPIRNEIGNLEVIKIKDFNKLKKKDKNYLVVGTRKLYVYRTNYKTDKIYGTIKTDITDKLFKKELKKYLETFNPGRTALFLNKSGTNMNHSETSNRLSYITEKYSGHKLSTSSIFKIMLANFKGKDMKEYTDYINKVGAIRGTDPKTLINYYVYNKKEGGNVSD